MISYSGARPPSEVGKDAVRTGLIAALWVALICASAAAQPWPAASAAPAVAPATAPAASFGQPLAATDGPWVFGEALFFSAGRVVSDYAWRTRLSGTRDQLYSASDLQRDVASLLSSGDFDRVTPSLYAIPGQPIPPQFAGLAVSTSEVRVVFDVAQKARPQPKPQLIPPPSAVSGLILTPAAYRGAGKYNTPGLGLDVNAAYFIGRLYGKNSYPDAPERTGYLDRVGLWTLAADGKMQVQSEGDRRPAVAVGGQALLMFRDSPQPTVTAPGVSVRVDAKTTRILTDGYLVASKSLRGARLSAGVMQGNLGDLPANLSQYLTPEAVKFYARDTSGTVVYSRTMPFVSAFYLLKPDFPVGFEVIQFNGAARQPLLINLKLGRFLRLNFDVAVLKYRGGYDVLGLFQFRYNHFPSK